MIINDKIAEAVKDSAKWQKWTGKLLIVVAIFALSIPDMSVGLIVLSAIIGVLEVISANKKFQNVEDFYKYKEFIGDKNEIRIEDLARTMTEEKSVVLKKLEWMVKKGFFEDVEIESSGEFFRSCTHYKWKINSVVPTKRTEIKQNEDITEKQWHSQRKNKEKNIYYLETCECCGGTTKIRVGGSGVCEYCRAPIGMNK